jgi:hypothetical protein
MTMTATMTMKMITMNRDWYPLSLVTSMMMTTMRRKRRRTTMMMTTMMMLRMTMNYGW